MSLVDYDDPAVWASLYHYWTPGGFAGYERGCLANPSVVAMHDTEMAYVSTAIGLNVASSVILVGGGFGWRAEALQRLLPGIVVYIVDTSQYILDNAGTDAVLTVNGNDISRPGDRNRILRDISRDATHVLTEDVLASLSNADCMSFDGVCRTFNVPLCHLVATLQPGGSQDVRLNWKSGEDWRVLLPHQPGGGDPQWIISRPELATF